MSTDPVDESKDLEDEEFFQRFSRLRRTAVRVARGLTGRIQTHVAGVERPPPALSSVLFGGLVELLNVVARLFGAEEKPDE